jgi:SAM-dependent methyltransferase
VKSLFHADGLAAAALVKTIRSFSLRHSFADRAVLDLGCGTMPYRSIFTARGARYIGADIDGTADILIDADGAIPLADESVDFVVSFQVLEHVRHVPEYLATIKRVLRKDGRLLLSTHGVWPYHPHPTDFWRWTRDGLQETLREAGFQVHSVTSLCGPAAWIAMFPLLACKKILGPLWVVLGPVNLCINLLAWGVDRVTPASLRDTNAAIFAVELSRQA